MAIDNNPNQADTPREQDHEETNPLNPGDTQLPKEKENHQTGRTIPASKKSRLLSIAEKTQGSSTPQGDEELRDKESSADPSEILELLRAAPSKSK
jgi:hypothetical protein